MRENSKRSGLYKGRKVDFEAMELGWVEMKER